MTCNVYVALVTANETWPTGDDDFELKVVMRSGTDIADFKELVQAKAKPVLDHLNHSRLQVFTRSDRSIRLGPKVDVETLTVEGEVSLYVLYQASHSEVAGAGVSASQLS